MENSFLCWFTPQGWSRLKSGGAQSSFWLSHMGGRTQMVGLSLAVSLGILARIWIRSREARTFLSTFQMAAQLAVSQYQPCFHSYCQSPTKAMKQVKFFIKLNNLLFNSSQHKLDDVFNHDNSVCYVSENQPILEDHNLVEKEHMQVKGIHLKAA